VCKTDVTNVFLLSKLTTLAKTLYRVCTHKKCTRHAVLFFKFNVSFLFDLIIDVTYIGDIK